MPQTIGCPTCSAKLKVPDNAGGRRVKCPKCGGVIAIPSGVEPAPAERAAPPATPAEPVAPPPPANPPPARARRPADDPDDRPLPATRAARRSDDDDDRPPRRPAARRDAADDQPPTGDDAARLHKGWKMVALGYRMFGLKMLFAMLGVLGVIAAFVAVQGWEPLGDIIRDPKRADRKAEALLVPMAVGGAMSAVVGLFALLGHAFLMGMPKDEQGGKGKVLGLLMFVFLFLGLGGLNPILLPIYSAGVGTALGKPKLRRYGFGLYVWYAVGFILTPLLAVGAWYGTGITTRDDIVATLVGGVVALILGVLVFFSIWGTYAGLRRGIQASIRDRGIIGGEGPQPVQRKKQRRVDDDEDNDRPRKKERRVDENDDRPRKKERRVDEDARDEPPAAARRAVRKDDDRDDERPKRRNRDDDSDDEIPQAKRRDDGDDESDDRPRKRR